MGNGLSSGETDFTTLPQGEQLFGLQNFGNTCYCNSVLQVLFHCDTFKQEVLQYYDETHPELKQAEIEQKKREKAAKQESKGFWASLFSEEENKQEAVMKAIVREDADILETLAHLFYTVNMRQGKVKVVGPKRFVSTLRRENELFNSAMHQDAHEFLNYLLNEVSEVLEAYAKKKKQNESKDGDVTLNGRMSSFIRQMFEGKLVNEIKCLCCDTVTRRDETFFDLSVDVQQNKSISACLRAFFGAELLSGANKFYCDQCRSLQEATKRSRIRALPLMLVIHLKRFKYSDMTGSLKKLNYRVAFPQELRLPEQAFVEDSGESEENIQEYISIHDQVYALHAVVVHIGQGTHHGHYVSVIRCGGKWLQFDDDHISKTTGCSVLSTSNFGWLLDTHKEQIVSELNIQKLYGAATERMMSSTCGYLLFYERTQQ